LLNFLRARARGTVAPATQLRDSESGRIVTAPATPQAQNAARYRIFMPSRLRLRLKK
jgi:hypothetical protein